MSEAAATGPSVTVDLTPATLLAGPPQAVEVLGNPVRSQDAASVVFDGTRDGLLIHGLGSIAGAPGFEIEAHIRPHPDGAFEQRFFHVQDAGSDDRLLMEIRLDSDGFWYADSYFQSGGGYAFLQDPLRRHPSGVWATYRVSYNGSEFAHFVDGTRELSVPFARRSLPHRGVISLGMRATREFQFSGEIGTILATRSHQT
jgi:hypothetical protein